MGNTIGTPSPIQQGVSEHDHWRAEARKHALQRNQYFEQSQEAYRSGRKAEAKQLSERGKAEAALMDKANEKASRAVYAQNNTGRDASTIDLHGLYVEEATKRARQSIQQAKREGKDHLVFIVGKGNHSRDGVQKLKPAIEELAREECLTCIPNKPNAGCVYVILEGEGKFLEGLSSFFKKIAAGLRKIFHS